VKTVTVSKRSRAVNALLDDGTQFVIRAIGEFGREIEAQRRNKKLMAFLDKCTRETEWTPLAEVERELGLPPRKARRRRP